MKKLLMFVNSFIVAAFILSSCTRPAPSPTPEATLPPVQPTSVPTATQPTEPEPTSTTEPAGEEPIYLSLIWHQHQPVYYKDPETGVYAKPWVRVHAAKDYVDMASILEQYPDIRATYNLTPSLIRQLDDLQAGAKDAYQVVAEIPADQLSDEQKQFLLDRFFDTNRKIIGRFPRYQELLQMRDNNETYQTQDYLDLQMLFNLAWTDPDWLAQDPLAALVAKGRDFSEADKAIVFDEHKRLVSEVIPLHKKLQDSGQIEVTMTPYTHPILPLLVSSELAKEAMPDVELPSPSFTNGQDAIDQVNLGVQYYQEHFGQPPRGMWPAEGSVAQEIVNMVSRAGLEWMATDEGVLANSLGSVGFKRDSKEVVTEPEVLYRPYYVQGGQSDPVAILFRDRLISDKVGFQYSGMSGELAAKDFLNRVHAIRDALKEKGEEGPFLVTVLLDGENAWEHYDNDGKAFLHSLYQSLSEDPLIKTVTPSEFLEIAPEQPTIEDLWAGSWITSDFSTWIGEEEENTAWSVLSETRAFLQKYLSGVRQPPSQEALQLALDQMYIAEGSDWFWWYGADQNSGDDLSFDKQFRETLKQVYLLLGETPPVMLDVPIIPQQPVGADQASTGPMTPTLDGVISPGEWDAAGLYLAEGGVMANSQPYFESLAYGFDANNFYLLVVADPDYTSLSGAGRDEIYLSVPGSGSTSPFSVNSTLLGFPANRMILVEVTDGAVAEAGLYAPGQAGGWEITEGEIATGYDPTNRVLEIAAPLSVLGNPETGDKLNLRAIHGVPLLAGTGWIDTDVLPGIGPAQLSVPDLGTTTVVLDIQDPEKDDHGPGTYTYPKDVVFAPGNFDILNFQVGFDENNIVFKITTRGPIDNPWGSPNGLSVQTFDIYIDTDGNGQGGAAMLPGRNLAFQEGFAWDFAITAEGWESGVYTPDPEGQQQIATSSDFVIQTDPGQQKVTIRVPKTILGENPQEWQYAAAVLGQEGYPAGGVMRVRDVNPSAEQWRFGGAPVGATNHTRVIDIVWPTAGEQETFLSDFAASSAVQTELTTADFAKIPMLAVAQ
jgi:alpha-amylase/alpha-mannosidase (GH57 family)